MIWNVKFLCRPKIINMLSLRKIMQKTQQVEVHFFARSKDFRSDKYHLIGIFNPFLTNVPILYPLKTPENIWFSGVIMCYKMGAMTRNRLKSTFKSIIPSLNITRKIQVHTTLKYLKKCY